MEPQYKQDTTKVKTNKLGWRSRYKDKHIKWLVLAFAVCLSCSIACVTLGLYTINGINYVSITHIQPKPFDVTKFSLEGTNLTNYLEGLNAPDSLIKQVQDDTIMRSLQAMERKKVANISMALLAYVCSLVFFLIALYCIFNVYSVLDVD